MTEMGLTPDGRVRRRVLAGLGGLGLTAGLVGLTARPAMAEVQSASLMSASPLSSAFKNTSSRTLSLHNVHTGERLTETYWRGGYQAESLARINHLLRDWRSGEVIEIDRNLLDLLHAVSQRLGTTETFDIISGYRSPKTNANLRKKSSGVAKNSFHTKGKAMDIHLPGQGLKGLRNAAWEMQAGGVGYYAKSGFVHVDTGRVRYWNWKPA